MSYKYLSLIGPPDISIRIDQHYLVSSENIYQELSTDVIRNGEKDHVKLGDISSESVLFNDILNRFRFLEVFQ